MSSMERIQDFLGQKRLAVVGVSRRPNDFSRLVFREFRQRGYDAVPVNPESREIDGERCFARLEEIQPPVDSVLFMTAPAVTANLVRDCAGTTVKRVWIYRGAGADEAVRFCESNGISAIAGECPFMFLPGGAWFHRFHGFIQKITGSYPK